MLEGGNECQHRWFRMKERVVHGKVAAVGETRRSRSFSYGEMTELHPNEISSHGGSEERSYPLRLWFCPLIIIKSFRSVYQPGLTVVPSDLPYMFPLYSQLEKSSVCATKSYPKLISLKTIGLEAGNMLQKLRVESNNNKNLFD